MTVIEIRPHRNGWKVFEAPGVEPVFLTKNTVGFSARNYFVTFRRKVSGMI